MKKRISNLKNRAVELTQTEKSKKKKEVLKSEDSLMDLWDKIKQNNCIIGISERENIEKGTKNVCEEIMAENFPTVETDIQIQEAQRVPNKMKNNLLHARKTV